jgi:hypothetical protein
MSIAVSQSTMSIFDVPESDWVRFCERFLRQNQGKSVTVELTADPDDPDAEREVLAASMPLESMSVTDVEHGEMTILLGATSGRGAEFTVSELERLRMEQHGEREGGLLRVEGTSQSLILRFAEPVTPGELDGLP